ncbi:MAG: ABC transporter substrate-binding protein [Chloroflexi bacterium]|nr:ABC transporter substrate-binding protein [Chloroflexota bacterium]
MRTKLLAFASLIIIASMVLTACGAPATTAPATQPPIVNTVIVAGTPQTVVVTATPAPAQVATFKSKDPTSFVEMTFGDPETLDPALDYETAGSAVIQNVYDTLLFYKKDTTDLVPWLATEIPTTENGDISADGLTYTLKLRTGVTFHDGNPMTATDVAYSLQRGLLQGGSASPQWLMFEPILGSGVGAGNNDITDLLDKDGSLGLIDNPEALQKVDPAALKAACEKVTSAIVPDDTANTVTFHLAQAWGPFNVTLAGSWASVMEKSWVAANGGWDGSCDTWQKFYGVTSDQINKTKIGTSEMGTGPYILDHWTPAEEYVLKANDNYWMKDPAWEGAPTGAPALKTVTVKSVSEFSTRFAALQAGDADMITPGSTSDWTQLDTLTGESCDVTTGQCEPTSTPDAPIRRYTGYYAPVHTDAFFNFKVDETGGNNFIGSGKLDGNGIPADFFSDVHIRKAFAYCFDWQTFINDTMQGQGRQTLTLMLPGQPGYDANAPHYTFDEQKCTDEFKASTLKSADGQSLWDIGFRMTVAYNTGNTQRQTIAQIFQTDLAAVNDKFVVEVTGLPWPTFLKNQRAQKLPMFFSGWQEDIPDPHNWVVPYTYGTYGINQNMPTDLLDQFKALAIQGVHESDPTKRAAIYAQVNQLYYDQVPTILLAQSAGHHYEQRWVKGWYFGQLYGDQWFYSLSKN